MIVNRLPCQSLASEDRTAARRALPPGPLLVRVQELAMDRWGRLLERTAARPALGCPASRALRPFRGPRRPLG